MFKAATVAAAAAVASAAEAASSAAAATATHQRTLRAAVESSPTLPFELDAVVQLDVPRELLVERCAVAPDKILVVPNAVELERFAPALNGTARPFPDPVPDLTLAFAGGLIAWQALDLLLEAIVKQVPPPKGSKCSRAKSVSPVRAGCMPRIASRCAAQSSAVQVEPRAAPPACIGRLPFSRNQ